MERNWDVNMYGNDNNKTFEDIKCCIVVYWCTVVLNTSVFYFENTDLTMHQNIIIVQFITIFIMQPTKTKDRMTFGNAPLAPHFIFLFPQLYKQNVGTYVIYCRKYHSYHPLF